MKKYLNTRNGSIEEAAIKTVEQNITFKKEEIKLEQPKNRYLNTRENSLESVVTKVVTEETEYQKMFKKELEKTGKPISQMSDAEKKAFFNKIDSKYTAKDEETKINEISDKDKRDNLQKIKAINDMVGDIPGVNNSDYKRLVDLGKPLNYYQNSRGATDTQKKQFIDFAKKFSNKMSFRDKQEYEGYLKAVTEAVEVNEEDAYQNDRFAVSGNTAKIDNGNTPDKSNHVHAPNAKTAVAMYKAGVKSYKDNADMRKRFPMAVEEAVDNPYAVGMAQAMKSTGDKPPLKKSTIVKAHDIAKSIEKDEKKEGYEGKSFKSYKDMKKESEMAKNKKTTMTDKPVTPIDTEPKTDSNAGYQTNKK